MRIPLTEGFYKAPSIIANAQSCINLYPEANPAASQVNPASSQAPVPYTTYPTPGLTLLGTPPTAGIARQLYRASNGVLYAVIGATVYWVDSNFSFHSLGSVTNRITPTSAADNGQNIILVDGSISGYKINLGSQLFSIITDSNFLGGVLAGVVDTYIFLNQPGTDLWYCTTSGTTTFNPLFFGSKTGYPDPIVGVIVMHREIWVIGQVTTEIWYNAGNSSFPFAIMPGAFIEHGCVAPYSIAAQDLSVYWLSQDKQGKLVVLWGNNYQAKRISTHAIENVFAGFSTYTDAIGYTYQIQGHTFYVLTFPTADQTWVYDQATELWHQWGTIDNNGVLHRHRGNCFASAYGYNIVGDYQNGNLYALDINNYTDNGQPIIRERAFPHLLNDGNRVIYSNFQADMQPGTYAGSTPDSPPFISLSMSDDRGVTFGNPIQQSLGAQGQYSTNIQFNRLGMARDRVFKLSWSVPAKTALNGAFIDVISCGT